jgi:hypothetical protein
MQICLSGLRHLKAASMPTILDVVKYANEHACPPCAMPAAFIGSAGHPLGCGQFSHDCSGGGDDADGSAGVFGNLDSVQTSLRAWLMSMPVVLRK